MTDAAALVDALESTPANEIVCGGPTARQAGTIDPGGQVIDQFRRTAEASLFFFAKHVMGMRDLTDFWPAWHPRSGDIRFHLEECNWLQTCPPRRKLLLMARDHLKSSIVSESLPAHIMVQPQGRNIYFPGCQDKQCNFARTFTGEVCADPTHLIDNSMIRVLLAAETAGHAEGRLGVIESHFDNNELLRALWPQRCWWGNRVQRMRWNQGEMVLPRPRERKEASISAYGVGAAITGAHFDVHIFDDLVTEDAGKSETLMADAVRWFFASRALMEDQQFSLEFTLGTPWALSDLYWQIMHNVGGCGHGDATVEYHIRPAVEDGEIIFPEKGFTWASLEDLKRPDPALYMLLYMLSYKATELVDFNTDQVRHARWSEDGLAVLLDEDERDGLLARKYFGEAAAANDAASGDPMLGMTVDAAAAWAKAHDYEGWMAMRYGSAKAG